MRRLTGTVVLVASLAFAGAGCSATTTTPTTPTTPTLPLEPVTESFAGSITTNGAVTFQFLVKQSGLIQATLKSLSPDSAIAVGLALGTWNGEICQVVLANDQATLGFGVTGSVSTAATLCLRIYDIGQLTQPNSFELTVIHP
jgi:hypothetical protein